MEAITQENITPKAQKLAANLSGVPHYATLKHPLIEAITAKLFRFSSYKHAVERIESLKLIFTVAKQQINNPKHPSLMLWIKGFQLSAEDKKRGYMGHIAIISIDRLESGQYTLQAQKLEVELKFHPMRKITKAAHPNWGHPLLRRIHKEELFDDIESARKMLQNIQKSYPDSSILCTNKLYTIIFTREGTENDTPTQKYVLEIKPQAEGGFRIEYKKNAYKAPKKLPQRKNMADRITPESLQKPDALTTAPQGHFTRLLQEKRDK